MDIAIGLLNAVPRTSGGQLVEWARQADARGFSSLGTIDRVVYENYEPLTALAAAAAVTERIGLCTSVLLGPLRTNSVELAKQAGREGEPRRALAYFALGERAEEDASAYLTDYYAWLGEEIANLIVAGAAKDSESVRQQVAAYDAAGCDELILFPSSADPDQVDLLAAAVGL